MAGGNGRVDVAVAEKGQISFQVQKRLPFSANNGHFHAIFAIKGVYRQSPLNCQFDLDFSYDGDTKFVCSQEVVELKLKKGTSGYEAKSDKKQA